MKSEAKMTSMCFCHEGFGVVSYYETNVEHPEMDELQCKFVDLWHSTNDGHISKIPSTNDGHISKIPDKYHRIVFFPKNLKEVDSELNQYDKEVVFAFVDCWEIYENWDRNKKKREERKEENQSCSRLK